MLWIIIIVIIILVIGIIIATVQKPVEQPYEEKFKIAMRNYSVLQKQYTQLQESYETLKLKYSPYEKIINAVYVPGKFLNATLDKASKDNERQLLAMKTKSGKEI